MRRAQIVVTAAALAIAACEQAEMPFAAEGRPGRALVPAEIVEGNPTCTALGYNFGFKVDSRSNFNGTYVVASGTFVIGSVTVSTADQITFNWTSTFGVDAVIAKGGNIGANVFRYGSEVLGDTGLQQPNNSNGMPAGISHIDFCFDFELSASKDAVTKYTRTFNWSIDKVGSDLTLLLNRDQAYALNYTVSVVPRPVDSDWGVTGTILIKNPSPIPAVVNSVSDVISTGITAAVSCPALPATIAAGGSLTCSYDAALPDASARTNNASVTTDGGAVVTLNQEDGTTQTKLYGRGAVGGAGASAAVVFGAPTSEVDESITVSDTYAGSLGSATRTSRTFSYSRTVSFSACGTHSVPNTASFIGGDTGATGSDSWDVTVTVTGCDNTVSACTLTQGYWKTHSKHGPARYDAAWGDREDTPFYLSGNTWLGVLRTPPRGDAYYILAHQFIAASLNRAAGADITAISAALSQAQTLLSTATPGSVRGSLRDTFLALATTLDRYNNGLIGPGHCSEN